MTKYDPNKHHRRSIRLPGYDYSQSGAYFVTICVDRRKCMFGDVADGQMRLNKYGAIVADEWQKSSVIRQEIELDAWVVMPNHFHGIVIITNNPVGANGRSPLRGLSSPQLMKPKSLSSLMAGFKSVVTKKINILRDAPRTSIWIEFDSISSTIRSPGKSTNYTQIILQNGNCDRFFSFQIHNAIAFLTAISF